MFGVGRALLWKENLPRSLANILQKKEKGCNVYSWKYCYLINVKLHLILFWQRATQFTTWWRQVIISNLSFTRWCVLGKPVLEGVCINSYTPSAYFSKLRGILGQGSARCCKYSTAQMLTVWIIVLWFPYSTKYQLWKKRPVLCCSDYALPVDYFPLAVNVALVTALETESHEVSIQFDWKPLVMFCTSICAFVPFPVCFGKFNTKGLSPVEIPTLKTVLVPLLSGLNFHKLSCSLCGQIPPSIGFNKNNVWGWEKSLNVEQCNCMNMKLAKLFLFAKWNAVINLFCKAQCTLFCHLCAFWNCCGGRL